MEHTTNEEENRMRLLRIRQALKDKRGAAMVEYALLVAGVALVAAAGVSVMGHKTSDMIATVAAVLPGAHADDNGPITSGRVIETAAGAGGSISLDIGTIAGGGVRLDTNLGFGGELGTLVTEP